MNEGTGNGKFFEALNGLISGLKRTGDVSTLKFFR